MGRLIACPSEVDYYHFFSNAKIIIILQIKPKKAEKFNPSRNFSGCRVENQKGLYNFNTLCLGISGI